MTAKRLNLAEKSWTKLAKHFAMQISDRDTKDLIEIQKLTENWKDTIVEVRNEILKKELKAKKALQSIRGDFEQLKNFVVPIIL